MIILNCDQHRNLSFVDKKYRILQGEHKFDLIKINMPESIDGVDDMQGVSIKMHFVSGNEHIDRQVVLENGYISTDIDYTLTEKSKRWLLYLAFYVNVDGEVEIGKTNAIAIQVNKLPYSDTLAKEYKEPEIVLIKGDKGDKGDPGEDGKSAYEIAVEHGYEGTEEEWLSEMKDYNELDNKPQINGHTLSGNQSIDDLGLQDKLTAGENITIEGNVISATGGVTDYDELENKPILQIQSASGTTENITLESVVKLFPFYKDIWTDDVAIDDSIYYKTEPTGITSLTSFDGLLYRSMNAVKLYGVEPEGIPQFINAKDNKFIIFSFGVPYDYSSQLILWIDEVTSNQKMAYRICEYNHDTHQYNTRDFIEIGSGGAQIVSAVVNANGTITFTDSEGNSFTTSGESVIGPPGQDYVLTDQDKTDIANIVLSELPTTEGVLYGNQSN